MDGAAKERRSRRGTSAEVSFLKRKSGSGRDVSSENLPCPLLPARPLSSLETQTRRREERGGFFRSLALRPPSDTRSAVSFSSSAETEMPPRRSSRRGAVGGEHTGGGWKALRGQGETSHKALLFFPSSLASLFFLSSSTSTHLFFRCCPRVNRTATCHRLDASPRRAKRGRRGSSVRRRRRGEGELLRRRRRRRL